MTSMKKRIAAALTAATLTIGLTVPAAAAEAPNEPIRVPRQEAGWHSPDIEALETVAGPHPDPITHWAKSFSSLQIN